MVSTASHPQNTGLFFRFRQAYVPTTAKKAMSRKTTIRENVSDGMAYSILAPSGFCKGPADAWLLPDRAT